MEGRTLPMTLDTAVPLQPDRISVGGKWVTPSSTTTLDVIDSGTVLVRPVPVQHRESR
jgi:hypothetical protein